MQSVRKALREKALFRDTYERLTCAQCERQLKTQSDPGEVGTIRICPDCGTQWRELR